MQLWNHSLNMARPFFHYNSLLLFLNVCETKIKLSCTVFLIGCLFSFKNRYLCAAIKSFGKIIRSQKSSVENLLKLKIKYEVKLQNNHKLHKNSFPYNMFSLRINTMCCICWVKNKILNKTLIFLLIPLFFYITENLFPLLLFRFCYRKCSLDGFRTASRNKPLRLNKETLNQARKAWTKWQSDVHFWFFKDNIVDWHLKRFQWATHKLWLPQGHIFFPANSFGLPIGVMYHFQIH
jgi:hypothetical protein